MGKERTRQRGIGFTKRLKKAGPFEKGEKKAFKRLEGGAVGRFLYYNNKRKALRASLIEITQGCGKKIAPISCVCVPPLPLSAKKLNDCGG